MCVRFNQKRNGSIALVMFLLVFHNLKAQDDILSSLKSEQNPPQYATSTFKSTRVINSQSVETLSRGNLDFRISHRFGRINSGSYNFYELDEATIRLALEYGVSDRIMIGVGRSSFEKTADGFLKVKLLRQGDSVGSSSPFSVTWFSNVAYNSFRNGDPVVDRNSDYRFSYAHQLILARKFSSKLSIQLAPILIHRNLKERNESANDTYAIESGGRFKISKRTSVNFDYVYRLPRSRGPQYNNSLSFGFDIDTGGHVFQLHLTNSQGMIEEMFVGRTSGLWNKGDIFYGFNISRRFVLKKPRD
jgi:hypothetical protein